MAAKPHEKIEKPIAGLVVALVAREKRERKRPVDLAVRPKLPPIGKRGESPLVAPVERHDPVGVTALAANQRQELLLVLVVERQRPVGLDRLAEKRREHQVLVVVVERNKPIRILCLAKKRRQELVIGLVV